MVEYGGGISHGPAGQVAGGGGPQVGQSADFFGSFGHTISDTANTILAQPPEVLVAAFFVILLGLVVLRRAF